MFITFSGDTVSSIMTAANGSIQSLIPLIVMIISIVVAFYVLRQIIFNLKIAK